MSVIELNTRSRKVFAIAWALLEILLFASLFFGWGTLVFMLKKDGVYSYLCDDQVEEGVSGPDEGGGVLGPGTTTSSDIDDVAVVGFSASGGYDVINNRTQTLVNNNTTSEPYRIPGRRIGCPEQDKKFNLGFTIVSGLWPYLYGVLGQLGHKFGTRFLRLSSIFSFIIGSLMVAFTTPEVPWLAFVGLFLYGISGCSLLFSNLQLSYLFVRGRTLVCALMTGSFDTSIATQLYIKVAYDRGIERKTCYIFLACVHVMTFISTFLWLPKSYIKLPETRDKDVVILRRAEEDTGMDKSDQGLPNGRVKECAEYPTRNGEMELQPGSVDDSSTPLNSPAADTRETTLRGHVCSQVFLMHILWYSVLQLRFFYFVGTLNPWLERVSSSEEEVSRYTDISMFCMMGGILTSFVAGSFYDMQKQRYKDNKSDRRRKLGPVVLPLTVGTVLGLVLTATQMIPSNGAIYASFISLTAFRSFLYAIGNGYLSDMFPSKYFSSLSGVLMILTGSAGFVQYIFFYWTESYPGAFLHVDIFLLVLVLSSLAHPLYQWRQCLKSD